MATKMPPERIDRMAEQFVGIGGHRAVPTFGFDLDLQLKPLKGIEIRLDELPPRRPATVGQTPAMPLKPDITLPSPIREILGV
jgi:hypothetical protein